MTARRTRKVFVWSGAANEDWTAGDAIAVAFDADEARKLLQARSDAGFSPEATALPGFGRLTESIKREPDWVIPLNGFAYLGPGGS